MSAPMVTAGDLERLAQERLRTMDEMEDLTGWLEEAGIEPQAIVQFGQLMCEALQSIARAQGGLQPAIVMGFAASCFQVGWDAHYQTRGERP